MMMKWTMRAAATAAAIVVGLLLTAAGQAKNDKVTLCHKGKEISISENAVGAHLRNHDEDYVGPCQADVVCPCWTAEQVSAGLANATEANGNRSCDAGVIGAFPDDDEFFIFSSFWVDAGPGDTFGAVDYDMFGNAVESNCIVDVDGEGGGADIPAADIEGLSLDEVLACRQAIADSCDAVLP